MHILKIRLNYETFFEFRPSLDIRFARLSLRGSSLANRSFTVHKLSCAVY